MPKKELKQVDNKNDANEILMAINENIGIGILELSSEIKKLTESNDEIVRLLRKKGR